MLKKLSSVKSPMSAQVALTPFIPPLTPAVPARKTQIMSIINLTPDSFSDGGVHLSADSNLHTTISHHISAGATILDLGGQSTRPHAPQVTAAEELDRIMPAIKVVQGLPSEVRRGVAISIDTYRADVAREAVKAGADIVNDVSAGQLDQSMLSTMAELGKTVILMHMRGTPSTMNDLAHYPDGVVETVGRELAETVKAAEAAGIRRWRIILDPGIGFAKNQSQNLELLRRLHELRHIRELQGLPWLVGPSRKRFIGKITGVEDASKRGWGTAAAVAAAVQGGAEIVRVHDVEEMAAVVKVSDAIWRA